VCGATTRTGASGGDGVQRGSSVEEAAVGKGVRHAPGARDWRHQVPGRQGGGAAEAWEPRWVGGGQQWHKKPARGPARGVCGWEDGETMVGCSGPGGKGEPRGVPRLWEDRASGEHLPPPLAQWLGREQAAGAG
jgi:hypothetical protein